MFSFCTDAGVWTPTRLIQGACDGPSVCQATLSRPEVLGQLIAARRVVLYIDDLLVCGSSFDELVDTWIVVLQRLHACGLKLSATKLQLFADPVKFCGKLYGGDGVRFDDAYVRSLLIMQQPVTVAVEASGDAFLSYRGVVKCTLILSERN